MILTTEERRLLALYHSGSAAATADVMRDALSDITEPDERIAAESVLQKLERMGDWGLYCVAPESVTNYD